MKDQHEQILGYRDLSQTEIAMMNEAKELAEQCGRLISKLRQHKDVNRGLSAQKDSDDPPLDQRWVSIGATYLQQGFMAVIRGIAQPTTF